MGTVPTAQLRYVGESLPQIKTHYHVEVSFWREIKVELGVTR